MRKLVVIILICLAFGLTAKAAEQFVFFEGQAQYVNFSSLHGVVKTDADDFKGVHLAVENMKKDLLKVMGRDDLPIVVGTYGKAKSVNKYLKKAILKKELEAKREKFIITFAGNRLVIAGSDKRGTIYGVYEFCRQIGVSPWYDWADVPVKPQKSLYIKKGVFTDGEPAVRYRGIFLNDEAPCLSGWVRQNYGGVYNHKFYERVFELLLRLKANFMWPAMWSSAFYSDDPLNMQTADDMGIIMGTSHHEPMGRAHQEWRKMKNRGAWNFDSNRDQLEDFWRSGVERLKDTEDVVTIGMRGDGDEPMGEKADVELLERIVNSQRKLIEQATGKPAEQTPQVWALYKEVQEYYEKGMRVPDDVILLLCDDNWGNVRILPELDGSNAQGAFANRHKGGYGLYYHVDYVGAPRNSKWINVSQIQRMWEQMQLTYDYGVDKLWILNVGDLKPMEFPIDFWCRMAWNPKQFNPGNLRQYTEQFCSQLFGERFAAEAARILNLQCKYSHRRTAESLDANTFNLENGEWKERVEEYDRLNQDAVALREQLPGELHDTYDQIIAFPVAALDNLYNMYYAQAMNRYMVKRNSVSANKWADKVNECFDNDKRLTSYYNHEIAGGKWNHFMDEVHIGYTSWNGPKENIRPQVTYLDVDKAEPETELVIKPRKEFVMEGDEYVNAVNASKASWQVIPDFGIYKSAVALFPYTESTEGASLEYAVDIPADVQTSKLTLALAPTFPFNSGRGMRIRVSVDGNEISTVNVNEASRYVVQMSRDQNFEWETTRVNRHVIPIQPLRQGRHMVRIEPLDPAIVIERITIQ